MLINPMNVYIRQIAEDARRACEEAGVIQGNKFLLTEKDMHSIIEFFNGNLVKQSPSDFLSDNDKSLPFYKSNSVLEKTSDTKFCIRYDTFSAIDILHELGHVFLEFDRMSVGDTRGCHDINSGLNEIEASKFARAFIMPSALFESAIVDSSSDGKCNISLVADKFGVDYLQVVSYGREAYYWD